MRKRKSLPLMAIICAASFLHAGEKSPPEPKMTPLITEIKCQTFDARIVSVCYPTKDDNNPPACMSQSLKYTKDVNGKKQAANAIFKNGRGVLVSDHAWEWQCIRAFDNKEYLLLEVSDWFDKQSEGLKIFDGEGKLLSKKIEDKVYPSQSAIKDEQITAKGSVKLPEYE